MFSHQQIKELLDKITEKQAQALADFLSLPEKENPLLIFISQAPSIIKQLLEEWGEMKRRIKELKIPLESDFDEKVRNSVLNEVLTLFEE